MHHSFIDEYSYIVSPVHCLPVKLKLFSLGLYVLAVALTPVHIFWAFIIYGLLLFLGLWFSRLPAGFILKRLKEILPFIIIILISVPFMRHENRLLVFSRCLIRAVLASTAMIVILSTTRFTQLLEGLRAFGVPVIFIRMFSFMYRYIFILEDELEKMKRSFLARSVRRNKGWLALKVFANLLGVLFIRAFERSERIYLAMQARGYDGAAGN